MKARDIARDIWLVLGILIIVSAAFILCSWLEIEMKDIIDLLDNAGSRPFWAGLIVVLVFVIAIHSGRFPKALVRILRILTIILMAVLIAWLLIAGRFLIGLETGR